MFYDTVMMSKITVKWSDQEYVVDVHDQMTVFDFKNEVEAQTGVKPDKQKLINLRHLGKAPPGDMKVLDIKMRPNTKIMMIGSLDRDIAEIQAVPVDLPPVINDMDIPEEKEIAIKDREEYMTKVQKRIKDYKIKILNDIRIDKNLLVLDIDYTLFDHRSTAETAYELMRPFLHEFLTSAYKNYDIVIWSATSMKWIEEKMKLLGVSTHSEYKIAFYLDSLAMITVDTPDYGIIEVKPLGVIWGKFPTFSSENTIMFDDLRRNFIMNPQNGLKIKPFRKAHENRFNDRELLKLAKYLEDIAKLDNFLKLNHSKWENYKKGGY